MFKVSSGKIREANQRKRYWLRPAGHPIMDLISGCRFVAQGTDELEALLGAKADKLEALLGAIAKGKKITVVRKKRT